MHVAEDPATHPGTDKPEATPPVQDVMSTEEEVSAAGRPSLQLRDFRQIRPFSARMASQDMGVDPLMRIRQAD